MSENSTDKRSLKEIKTDVLRHDTEALGLRLVAISKSIGNDSSQQDLFAIEGALIDVREQLRTTITKDLAWLQDNTESSINIPF